MTGLQKVQLRMSEVREKLNELGGKDKPTDDDLKAMKDLGAEYSTLEVRFRSLVAGESKDGADKAGAADGDDADNAGATDDDAGDSEERERAKLEAKVELRAYLSAAMEGRALDGAEAEFNESLGVQVSGGGVQVPWQALAPTVEERAARRRIIEERADVATSPGAAMATENMQPILARVFQRSIAAWLGVTMPMAGVGERNYPVMTAGTTGAMVAAGGAHDAAAATYTVTVINPTRLTARYLFRVEDLATVAGLEASLRSDLRMVMSDTLDAQILTGDGAAPNLAGLFDADSGLADPAAPTAEADVEGYIDLITGQVDGINAYDTGDVRLLIGPATLRHAATKFITGTDTSALDKVRMLAGGVRTSARVPAVKKVAQKDTQELMAVRMNGFAVAPMWPTLSLIRDVYSGASKGEVALTAIALYGFKVVRSVGYARLQVRLQA